jgi:hypothetical protein
MQPSMTERQRAKYNLRLGQYSSINDLTPGMESMIYTLACVEVEEEMLQEFVNDHGTCYDVQGVGGDIYSRARPQWQQLKEARMRKQALIAKIESTTRSHDQEQESVEEYFT